MDRIGMTAVIPLLKEAELEAEHTAGWVRIVLAAVLIASLLVSGRLAAAVGYAEIWARLGLGRSPSVPSLRSASCRSSSCGPAHTGVRLRGADQGRCECLFPPIWPSPAGRYFMACTRFGSPKLDVAEILGYKIVLAQ
jgi:hypothetical protein